MKSNQSAMRRSSYPGSSTPVQKRLLQLSDDTVERLRAHAETGMGFYVVKGHFPETYVDRDFVIAGDHYIVPFRHPDIYSVDDLIEGLPFPIESHKRANFVISRSATAPDHAALPAGYKPNPACIRPHASVTLAQPTVCCRYLGSASDTRLSDGILAQDTLLTTCFDLNEVRTGFAAVARFALPLPTPASHVFEYELPEGTHLRIGTVPPCFSQMGGGVEIRLCASTPVVFHGYRRLCDF